VEGLHAIGDVFTKISVHFVLNYMLHYYVCIYVYGFFIFVVYTYFYIYE
jgi:hypothetical protein